jgi:hypothetical protein
MFNGFVGCGRFGGRLVQVIACVRFARSPLSAVIFYRFMPINVEWDKQELTKLDCVTIPTRPWQLVRFSGKRMTKRLFPPGQSTIFCSEIIFPSYANHGSGQPMGPF